MVEGLGITLTRGVKLLLAREHGGAHLQRSVVVKLAGFLWLQQGQGTPLPTLEFSRGHKRGHGHNGGATKRAPDHASRISLAHTHLADEVIFT